MPRGGGGFLNLGFDVYGCEKDPQNVFWVLS